MRLACFLNYLKQVIPKSGNLELSIKNIKSLDRVHCVKAALWNKDELVDILSPNRQNWAFRIGGHKPYAADAIPGYSVRSFANAHDIRNISLLTMDYRRC